MSTAVVIDGAYFIRRFRHTFPALKADDPQAVIVGLRWLAMWHLAYRLGPQSMMTTIGSSGLHPIETTALCRIFFYDCPPLAKRLHLPISKQAIDFSKTPTALFRSRLHAGLLQERKVALRLGRLNEDFGWRLKPEATKRLVSDPAFTPGDDDFEIDIVQKGVDMRLGLDVAGMAFKRQVDQIVLIAGDGDFVPAAKLARREGIDVVLDPMWGNPASDLLEHVDGVRQAKMEMPSGPTP